MQFHMFVLVFTFTVLIPVWNTEFAVHSSQRAVSSTDSLLYFLGRAQYADVFVLFYTLQGGITIHQDKDLDIVPTFCMLVWPFIWHCMFKTRVYSRVYISHQNRGQSLCTCGIRDFVRGMANGYPSSQYFHITSLKFKLCCDAFGSSFFGRGC